MPVEKANPASRGFGRRRRWLLASLSGIAIAIAGAEFGARFGLGLGDPPLSDAYPDLEYAFRPGTYRRFGNVVHINAHHMRSPDFPARKARADEMRVMLMGDSVINGGALTDQSALASEALGSRLAATLDRPVVVGNISAGSWGPGNLLAYARRFGFFEADVVVIVVNSEDAFDNPTGRQVVGVDPSFPDRRPWSALGEAFSRYVTPRMHRAWPQKNPPAGATHGDADVTQGMSDLAALCELAESAGARVLLVHFPNRDELDGASLPGHEAIVALAETKGIPFVELTKAMRLARDTVRDPYRPHDSIHPNELGQKVIADVLAPAIADLLSPARALQ